MTLPEFILQYSDALATCNSDEVDRLRRVHRQQEFQRAADKIDEIRSEVIQAAMAKCPGCSSYFVLSQQLSEYNTDLKNQIAEMEETQDGCLLARENKIKDLEAKLKEQAGRHSDEISARRRDADDAAKEIDELKGKLSAIVLMAMVDEVHDNFNLLVQKDWEEFLLYVAVMRDAHKKLTGENDD